LDLLSIPFAQRYYDANGVRTRVIEAGSGPPLLLLHGTSGHAEAFTRNIAAHAKHFRVLAVDMLGHGFTDKPDRPYEMDDYVGHILDVMDAAGIESAHIAGESLGGWAGAWMAAYEPARVQRLILNTPGGTTINPEVLDRLRGLTIEAVRTATRASVRKRLEWLMAHDETVTPELVEIRYAVYRRPEFVAAIDHITALLETERRRRNLLTDEILGTISAPTMVLWTSHDPSATVDEGRRIAGVIPGAEFVVMEDCGHWPQFEDAPTYNRISLEFLLNGNGQPAVGEPSADSLDARPS
jgi:2-hydroxy-6-oxonona-2,4-dienedioate hydrolase